MNTIRTRFALLGALLAFAGTPAHAATFWQAPANPHGRVHITNIAGSIVIRGWDKPTVEVRTDLPRGRMRVLLRSGHDRTRVCVTNNVATCSGSGRARPVRLEVWVPRASKVHASGVSARIASRGLEGAQHLRTVSGAIDASLGSGDDLVKSVTGNIDLRGSAREGVLRVESISGDVSVANVAGELDAMTVNGRLSAQIPSARRVRVRSTSGSIELEAHLVRGGSIQSETVSGTENIRVRAPAGYSYIAKSFSGQIENCFGMPVQHHRYGPGSRLEGTLGAGDGRVRVRSLSGAITLCDH